MSLMSLNHVKTIKPVIQIPAGYEAMRETGNILYHEGEYIYTTTCRKNGYRTHHIHAWTSKDTVHWQHVGKLDLKYDAEDNSLKFIDGEFWLLTENKVEQADGLHVDFYKSKSLAGKWRYINSYHANMTGKQGVYDVCSPVIYDKNTFLIGYRYSQTPSLDGWEDMSIVKMQGEKWGKLKTIFTAQGLGYYSTNLAGDVYRENGKYVAEVIGWLNMGKPSSRWVTGMAVSNRLEGGWKVINRELKDQDGNCVHPVFHKYEGKWFALAMKSDEAKEVYLAEIVTKPKPKKPDKPKGDKSMLDLKVSRLDGSKVLLEWNHPEGVNNVHFENDAGYFATKDVLAKGKFVYANVNSYTRFRARAENQGLFEDWVFIDSKPEPKPPTPPVEPSDDKQAIKDKLKEFLTDAIKLIDQL